MIGKWIQVVNNPATRKRKIAQMTGTIVSWPEFSRSCRICLSTGKYSVLKRYLRLL